MHKEQESRLRLLGLIDSGDAKLVSVVERHSILLGKLAHEVGLGNVLYGMEKPTSKILVATATASLTLTTSAQSIVGDGDSSKVRLLLPTPGDWLIEAACDLGQTGANSPGNLTATLYVDDSGTPEDGSAVLTPKTNGDRATVAQRWKVTTTATNTPVELKANMSTAGGNAAARTDHTRLTAVGGGTY